MPNFRYMYLNKEFSSEIFQTPIFSDVLIKIIRIIRIPYNYILNLKINYYFFIVLYYVKMLDVNGYNALLSLFLNQNNVF